MVVVLHDPPAVHVDIGPSQSGPVRVAHRGEREIRVSSFDANSTCSAFSMSAPWENTNKSVSSSHSWAQSFMASMLLGHRHVRGIRRHDSSRRPCPGTTSSKSCGKLACRYAPDRPSNSPKCRSRNRSSACTWTSLSAKACAVCIERSRSEDTTSWCRDGSGSTYSLISDCADWFTCHSPTSSSGMSIDPCTSPCVCCMRCGHGVRTVRSSAVTLRYRRRWT